MFIRYSRSPGSQSERGASFSCQIHRRLKAIRTWRAWYSTHDDGASPKVLSSRARPSNCPTPSRENFHSSLARPPRADAVETLTGLFLSAESESVARAPSVSPALCPPRFSRQFWPHLGLSVARACRSRYEAMTSYHSRPLRVASHSPLLRFPRATEVRREVLPRVAAAAVLICPLISFSPCPRIYNPPPRTGDGRSTWRYFPCDIL
ncbi:hypothetical protein EDB83DRAFT_1786530 [Lactarius deliciosus]|nr:hypothetical protein EDB83DRAFT_1786530 [Lactarius deliciosus]